MKKRNILWTIILCIILGVSLPGCNKTKTTTQTEQSKAVIIDTDPGTDDSTALMLAQANLKDNVKLLVSSYGNSPLSSTTENTAKLADLYGIKAEILQGAVGPAEGARPPSLTEGLDGIASAGLPQSTRNIIKTDTSDYLYDFLKAHPGSDYVVLGPMTNLANLLNKYPESEKFIGRVITMAGGLEVFNMDDCAEFNTVSYTHLDVYKRQEPYRDVIEIEDTSPKGELLLQTIKAKSNWSTIQTIVMDSSHPALEELIKVSLLSLIHI